MNVQTPLKSTVINGVTYNADAGQRPVQVDGATTIPGLFKQRCAELGKRTVHREKDLGIWKSYSWEDYWNHAKWIGMGLRKLGLKRGEVVSILSEDRKEWAYFDMGIQSVGGIASGVYTTDSGSQLTYLVNDSDSRFLVVENEEQLGCTVQPKHPLGITQATQDIKLVGNGQDLLVKELGQLACVLRALEVGSKLRVQRH